MKTTKLTKIIAGSLIALSALALNPIGASAQWKKDNKGWWYTENNSYATGWKNISGNWYYFYSDGYMATCDKIGGYFVNGNGVWTDSITAEEARQLILNEDGEYIAKSQSKNFYAKLSNEYEEVTVEDMIEGKAYFSIPEESCYAFYLHYYDNKGELCEPFKYLVGKNSKNVYSFNNQAYSSAYQIENNQKVKIFKWLGGGTSPEWR